MTQFSNILHVVGEEDTEADLQRSISLCQQDGVTLTLVSVVETMVSAMPTGQFHDELGEAFQALRDKRLTHLKMLKDTVPDGIETVCEVLDGKTSLEIIKRVLHYDHDLVVKYAQEETGPLRRLFASEDMQLLRKCPCPLLLLKRTEAEKFQHVFAAVDFDRISEEDTGAVKTALNSQIVDLAAALADQHGSKLDVVNVFTVPGEGAMVAGWIPTAPENLSDYAKRCRQEAERQLKLVVSESSDRLGLPLFDSDRLSARVVKGRARVDIPEQVSAVGADLVVMGTVGRGGVPGVLIGNTAETILGAIDCSVLALKPEGFETPVKLY